MIGSRAFIVTLIVAGALWYTIAYTDVLAALGLPNPIADNQPGADGLTPAQRAQIAATHQLAPGSAPIVPAPSFFGTPSGIAAIDSAILGTVGVLASAGVLGGAVVAGAATLGIGFAVAFLSYEYLKQRASMRTNDVRDAWQKQFVALHDALGIRKLTVASGPGGGGYSPGDDGESNGSVEMAEVIFALDHDSSQRLWHAVTDTQNEAQFRQAANVIDRFLTSRGVPVQDVSQ